MQEEKKTHTHFSQRDELSNSTNFAKKNYTQEKIYQKNLRK